MGPEHGVRGWLPVWPPPSFCKYLTMKMSEFLDEARFPVGKEENKYWYNVDTKEIVDCPEGLHIMCLSQNPDKFGVEPFDWEVAFDQPTSSPNVHAYKNGWIRVSIKHGRHVIISGRLEEMRKFKKSGDLGALIYTTNVRESGSLHADVYGHPLATSVNFNFTNPATVEQTRQAFNSWFRNLDRR